MLQSTNRRNNSGAVRNIKEEIPPNPRAVSPAIELPWMINTQLSTGRDRLPSKVMLT
jgi:hypothetical protein